MNLELLNDKVFIEEVTEKVTEHGIVIPDSATAKIGSIGIIYAIAKNDYDLKVGDKVIFSKYTAEDIILKEHGHPDKKLKSLTVDSLHAKILED